MVVNAFLINGSPSAFQNTTESFYNVLNGGNTKENELQYDFTLTDLSGHQIDYIVIESLLFDQNQTFGESTNYSLTLSKDSSTLNTYSGTIVSNKTSKTPFGVKFQNTDIKTESNNVKLTLVVKNTSNTDSYYGLYKIIVVLKDVLEEIHYTFSGPLNSRIAQSIIISSVVVCKGAHPVTFSKDPISEFNNSEDIVEGKIYYRKNGIFIDGYQYSTNTTASNTKKGVVKLQDSFNRTSDGALIAPNEVGVAASPQLVYEALSAASGGSTTPATPDVYGVVKLQHDFQIGEDGGIIAPNEAGIAASPVLVYNTLASAKNYVDEQTNFSDDFIRKDDSKLYIKWLTITKNGDLLTY